SEAIAPALSDDLKPDDDVVWLYSSADRQALIIPRGEKTGGQLSLRYLPIANLKQAPDGAISFERADWKLGLPLKMLADPRLGSGESDRSGGLSQWPTHPQSLPVLHTTQSSNT